MKRTTAAVATAVAATGSMWLVTAPAYAKPAPKPPTADAVAIKTVTVRKQLPGWTGSPPSLPRHFKPDLIVQTGVRQVIVSKPRLGRHAPRR